MQEYGNTDFRDTPEYLEDMSRRGKKGAEVCRKGKTGMFGFTFKERSERSKEYNTDRIWITDGTMDLRIRKDDIIPIGFYIGRTNIGDNPQYRKGMNCWTNGDVNIFSDESPGVNFRQGMIKETPTAILPWWTNGKINKRRNECPGDGFIPGRMKWKSKIVICPYCGKTGGETAMKRHHFDHCNFRGKNE